MDEKEYILDAEEQEILSAFEQGQLESVTDVVAQLQDTEEIARNTLNKSHRINLRLTERDFRLAHVRAIEEGMPYQTLLASVIHRYLTGRLVDVDSARNS